MTCALSAYQLSRSNDGKMRLTTAQANPHRTLLDLPQIPSAHASYRKRYPLLSNVDDRLLSPYRSFCNQHWGMLLIPESVLSMGQADAGVYLVCLCDQAQNECQDTGVQVQSHRVAVYVSGKDQMRGHTRRAFVCHERSQAAHKIQASSLPQYCAELLLPVDQL